MSDYDRIASAIHYINQQVRRQPGLEEIAAHVHLSPFHFQRLFKRWTRVSPKRFLQVLTLEYGKQLMHKTGTLLDIADEIGLSSSSRLYDHFVQIEAVTPGEYKRHGQDLMIDYGSHSTPFGTIFVATSTRGVCRAAFLEFSSLEQEINTLQQNWPLARFQYNPTNTAPLVDTMFNNMHVLQRPLSLYVKGTNFQIAVWRAMLRIPLGTVINYSQLANALNRPRSARAVGNAIAANPVAFLIPCHRIIRQTGAVGKYRWGETRKHVMQIWERTQTEKTSQQDA